jgi:hypothetical protein
MIGDAALYPAYDDVMRGACAGVSCHVLLWIGPAFACLVSDRRSGPCAGSCFVGCFVLGFVLGALLTLCASSALHSLTATSLRFPPSLLPRPRPALPYDHLITICLFVVTFTFHSPTPAA